MASTDIEIGPYVRGEKPAPLVYTFQDAAGKPIDLSGGYSPRVEIREIEATVGLVLTGPQVAFTNALGGEVTMTWTGNEFPTAGHYLLQFWVGNNTNRFASPWIKCTVREPVYGVPTI